MRRTRQMLSIVIGLELLVVLALVGWRLSRSAPPEVNLSRLPASTANALQTLRDKVWSDSAARWRELGEAFLAFGYCAEAEPCLRLAAVRSPRQFDTIFMHACSLERLGRFTEANEQFEAAAKFGLGREVQTCQSHIGRNSLRLDDIPRAEAAFARSLDLPAAQVERARMRVRTGLPQEALSILTRLRAKHDLDVRTEMIAVQTFRDLQRPQDAADAAERAERAQDRYRVANPLELLEPIRARYGLNAELSLGERLGRAGLHSQAAAVFDRALSEASWDFLELIIPTGAQLDMINQRPEAALAKLDRLSTRMDVLPEARLIWGNILAETSHPDRAMEQWSRAVAAQPSAQLHLALANGLLARGDEAGAGREQSAARLQQAIDKYHANELDVALSELNALRSEMPENPRFFYYLGIVSSALGQKEPAIKAFARCLSLDPLHGRAKVRLQRLTDGADSTAS